MSTKLISIIVLWSFTTMSYSYTNNTKKKLKVEDYDPSPKAESFSLPLQCGKSDVVRQKIRAEGFIASPVFISIDPEKVGLFLINRDTGIAIVVIVDTQKDMTCWVFSGIIGMQPGQQKTI